MAFTNATVAPAAQTPVTGFHARLKNHYSGQAHALLAEIATAEDPATAAALLSRAKTVLAGLLDVVETGGH